MPRSTGASPAPDAESGGSSVQVIDRALGLIKAISESDRPLTAVELAKTVKLNRSTAWRILATLEQHGLVERDTETGLRYVLGYFVSDLAARSHHDSLVRMARSTLLRLAESTGEFISLAVPQRLGIVYVDFVERRNSQVPDLLKSVSADRLHRAGPVHATSAGKIFLAWLPPDELDGVLPAPLERYTAATLTERRQLDKELATVRAQHYAVAYGEYEEYTSAISAPVLSDAGRLVAIANLFGPQQRLTRVRLRDLGPVLRDAGAEIAERLSQRAVTGAPPGAGRPREDVAPAG